MPLIPIEYNDHSSYTGVLAAVHRLTLEVLGDMNIPFVLLPLLLMGFTASASPDGLG
jgi:hypothetical protein